MVILFGFKERWRGVIGTCCRFGISSWKMQSMGTGMVGKDLGCRMTENILTSHWQLGAGD